jgi:hypothetical protein
MPQESALDYWVSSVWGTNSERTVTEGFWLRLEADIEAYGEAYNLEHLGHQSSLFETQRDGHKLTVNYGDHLLRLLLDERTGRLVYQFVSPKLAEFEPEFRGVTMQGEVFVDIRPGHFKATSSPHINLGANIAEVGAWPIHDRLAQYLMQKLIGPTIKDQRFMTPEFQH